MSQLHRRTLLTAGAAGTAALITGAAPPASAAPPRVGRVLARNLSVPWGLAFLPSGNALVAERDAALVHRVSRRGGSSVVGEVPNVRPDGEGGLLGLACDPDFRRNRWVYAYITTADDNRVVRMRYAGGRLEGQRTLIAGIPKAGVHNGGRLRFGPDGLLFVSTGDSGDTTLAQDLDSLGGKILRITTGGEAAPDNPYSNAVWSLGHRNVQGLAFDSRGRLWATEFGQSTRDELNRIVRGHNYGWPEVEGGDGPRGEFHDPLVTWRPTSTCSPSGLAVVRGHAYVGALAGQSLYRVDVRGRRKGRERRFLRDTFGRIRTVERAPDRTLWITTSNGARDRVVRIRLD